MVRGEAAFADDQIQCGVCHIPFSYWVFMNVIQLLMIKIWILNFLGPIGLLPKPILASIIHKQLQYAGFRRFEIALKFHGSKPFKVA
jgi:hypothetical protein